MKNIFILSLLMLAFSVEAQNFEKEFRSSFQKGDTVQQLKVLTDWQKANPKDPELYTSFYNFYFAKSKKEILSITADQPKGESFALKDSLNRTAGYLGSKISYKDRDLQQAFAKIDRGIELFPDRLDMRFGKIYGLGLIEDWNAFTGEVIKAVRHSAKNNNNWLWTNNAKREDGEAYFLSAIHGYMVQLYQTERDELITNMRDIALEVLKIYPNHIQSLSNLSITYYLQGNYAKGLEPLLRAEKIAPKDEIVLSNIANGYKQQGNKAKAIEYYEKVHLYGDQDSKDFANKRIAELRK